VIFIDGCRQTDSWRRVEKKCRWKRRRRRDRRNRRKKRVVTRSYRGAYFTQNGVPKIFIQNISNKKEKKTAKQDNTRKKRRKLPATPSLPRPQMFLD